MSQGLPYYLEFIKQFPDIKSLASASPDAVMKVWQGLGYYTRARKMQEAAKIVHEQYNDTFPGDYESLLKIPGIGPYTAAAIASFAYREPVPVVDGNVIRVLSRLFGLNHDPGSSKGKRLFHQTASEIIDTHRPGTFNQAIMEFGATSCLPRNPLCALCPLREACYAFKENKVDALPVKKPKKTTRKRYFHYLVIILNNRVLLRRREQQDIWRSLYEFPLVETAGNVPPGKLTGLKEFRDFFGTGLPGTRSELPGHKDQARQSGKISHSGIYKHILSHQQIIARFYLVQLTGKIVLDSTGFIPVKPEDLSDFPLPRLMDRFLESKEWAEWRSSGG